MKMVNTSARVAIEPALAEARETPKRRRYSVAEKRQIVEESFRPGTSLARVARAHRVKPNQVFRWRRMYQPGRPDDPTATAQRPLRIMKHRLMRALRMAITGPNGFRAAFLSEPDLGITAVIAFTGTSITTWTNARATADDFRHEESVLPNSVGSFAAKRHRTLGATKLRAGGKAPAQAESCAQPLARLIQTFMEEST